MQHFPKSLSVSMLALTLAAIAPMLACGEDIDRVARLSTPKPDLRHPIDPALEIARESLENVRANIEDYTAVFIKRCRVDGVLPRLQYASLKIRNRRLDGDQTVTPLSVYLDFLKPASVKGREVIWVEDANEGNMIVHQGGFASFLTTHVHPEGMIAMRGQRYSIKEIGIENLLEKIIATGQRDRNYDECEVKIHSDKKFGQSSCTMVEITHPVRRDHFRFHRARVYFDNALNAPIRYQAWLWPSTPGGKPVLDEEYNYFNLKVNVGLSATDFDPANPEYRFR